jgi:hypothetical protein
MSTARASRSTVVPILAIVVLLTAPFGVHNPSISHAPR